jgi:hypothetical protein
VERLGRGFQVADLMREVEASNRDGSPIA